MKKDLLRKNSIVVAIFISVILFNVIASGTSMAIGLVPVLGITGPMALAVLSGYFLSVWAVIISQIILSFFFKGFIYYSLVNILSVIITAFYYRKGYFKKKSGILLYLVINAGINSAITCIIESQSGQLSSLLFEFNEYNMAVGALPFSLIVRSFIIVFTSAIVMHALSLVLVYLVVKFVPDNIKKILGEFGWLQKPVDSSELSKIDTNEVRKIKLGTIFAIALIATCITILTIVAIVASSLFVRHTKDEHEKLAVGTSEMVAKLIDGDSIDRYIDSKGQSFEYEGIKTALYNIKDISDDIEYIYVYKITKDGCQVVFDLDTKDVKGSEPGTIIPFGKAFEPLIDTLLKGERVDPVVTNEYYGYLMTSYTPVYDSQGRTVCYAGADISMKYLHDYTRQFLVRLVILCSGLIIVIIVTGLWVSRYRIIYPVDTIVIRAKDFKYDSEEARKANLDIINDLEIRTGDEIERLYNSFVQVTKDSSKSFGKMLQKTDYIEKIQSDLIAILADMVENRDESTGDHVRKTSMYTIIIMNQMRRMGIHSGLLTDDYIEDVYKSAPLHDIGKIRIPDAILNKPGKLTTEEFDIMKKHAVYGGDIIDELIKSLTQASYLEVARDIALYHHEWWDGSGYPEGLKGEEIPLPARIMAVADVFDALISDRVYKKAFSFEKALEIIQEESGTHFDPDIVRAFMAVSDEVRQAARAQSVGN